VKSFFTTASTRFLVVATMLLAWLVMTNHCALASLQGHQVAADEVTCCHAKNLAPVKEAPCQEQLECCQAVKASLSGKAEAKYDASKYTVQLYLLLRVLAAEFTPPAPVVALDHGPPRAGSFAELVLQRSLLSHAPPAA
jgi:hypothetical protein